MISERICLALMSERDKKVALLKLFQAISPGSRDLPFQIFYRKRVSKKILLGQNFV